MAGKRHESVIQLWTNAAAQLRVAGTQPNPVPTFLRGQKDMRQRIHVSCWHMNSFESAAMWKLYLPNVEGIAIRSTFGRLKTSFDKHASEICIGKVHYVDDLKDGVDWTNLFYSVLTKRRSFEHEKELRAMLINAGKVSPGISVPIDIDILIDSIYVAPESPPWYRDTIEALIVRYGLSKTVIQSNLDSDPPY